MHATAVHLAHLLGRARDIVDRWGFFDHGGHGDDQRFDLAVETLFDIVERLHGAKDINALLRFEVVEPLFVYDLNRGEAGLAQEVGADLRVEVRLDVLNEPLHGLRVANRLRCFVVP